MLSATLQLLAPLTDEELVERILCGDTAVFELLMRRHNQRLYRLARSVIRDNDEAEEILQETYLRAYANLNRFEGRSSVITWLSRIAFHEALRRKRQRQRARGSPGFDLDSLPMSESTLDATRPVMESDLRAALTNAMETLPVGMRAIVMLRLVEGLSTRHTARSLGVSESYVKVGLHRARRQLREVMERRSLDELREAFAFGETRCDRVVRNVFERLNAAEAEIETRG